MIFLFAKDNKNRLNDEESISVSFGGVDDRPI